MNSNLEDLYIFSEVVEAGSLTAAALKLNIPKSKISRRLASLEVQIGSSLLTRTTRKQRLTESGTLLYQRSVEHLKALALVEEEVGSLISKPRGLLRVLLPSEFLSRLISEIIAEFSLLYPDITLCCSHYPGALPELSENFDLTFVLHEHDLPDSSWIARSLMSIPQSIYVSNAYCFNHTKARVCAESVGQSLDPEILGEECCVLNTGEQQWLFRDHQKIQSVPVKGRVHLSSPEMRIEAAVRGLGLLKLPNYQCETEVQRGALKELKLTAPPLAQELSVLYQSRTLPVKVRVFLDYFQSHIGRLYSIVR